MCWLSFELLARNLAKSEVSVNLASIRFKAFAVLSVLIIEHIFAAKRISAA